MYLEKLIVALNQTYSLTAEQTINNCDKIVEHLYKIFLQKRKAGATVYFIGNGGSAGIATHMAADFLKNGRIKTQTFYESTLMTCIANDYGYDKVFSMPFEMMAESKDVLVAISSSGKSPNILRAAETAKMMQSQLITFTGFADDNPVKKMGDISVYVPCREYGMVESIHNLILQQIVDKIKAFDEKEV